MDDTDRRLILLITEDPRMHVQEIAGRLGISRQAVDERLKAFVEAGVFKRMKATLSAHYLNAVPAAVWGRSESRSIEQMIDRLGRNEFVGRVIIGGGNYVYVLGCLRKMSDLDGYVSYIRHTAEMPEPVVAMAKFNAGIMPDWMDGGRPKHSYKKLSSLDLRIIASLQDDARKPAKEIAKSVGVSPKTVRRRICAMRTDGSLDFDQPWDLPCGGDMFTVLHVNLRSDADKTEVARRLLTKDPIHLFYLRPFSNLPNFLLGLVCSTKMSVVRDILKSVRMDKDVVDVMPNMIYSEHAFMNWMTRCGEFEKMTTRERR